MAGSRHPGSRAAAGLAAARPRVDAADNELVTVSEAGALIS
nr:hypothetical protein JVH1_0728 [Rhodococcus sp. JVH1]